MVPYAPLGKQKLTGPVGGRGKKVTVYVKRWGEGDWILMFISLYYSYEYLLYAGFGFCVAFYNDIVVGVGSGRYHGKSDFDARADL